MNLEKIICWLRRLTNSAEATLEDSIVPQQSITPILFDKNRSIKGLESVLESFASSDEQELCEPVVVYKSPRVHDFFENYGDSNRYVLQEIIGKGSYGEVCSAMDRYTKERVAIKKIQNVFEHVPDAIRILREVKLLRLLKHPDIVEIKHILLPPNPQTFDDLYVVFELMDTDLHQVIKSNDAMTGEHHQLFLYQMLRGLKYIHSARVFHRDLKPKNVLANLDCKLKICDFGLARPAFNDSPAYVMWTDYVATRWYRAPELCGMFYAPYTPAIDIWSVGCIFAEVILGRPLFPGRDVAHQLELITDLMGTPSPDVIAQIKNDKARRYLMSLPFKPRVSLSRVFPHTDSRALALLRRMLSFNPKERPSAEEALKHPYFAGIHVPGLEPDAQPVPRGAFDFEGRMGLSVEDVRSLLYREILEYHPRLRTECMLSGRLPKPCSSMSGHEMIKRQWAHLEGPKGSREKIVDVVLEARKTVSRDVGVTRRERDQNPRPKGDTEKWARRAFTPAADASPLLLRPVHTELEGLAFPVIYQ